MVCVCIRITEDNLVSLFRSILFVFLLLFFRQDLSLIRKGCCLSIRPQVSDRFHLPSPLITSVYHLSWRVQMASGD